MPSEFRESVGAIQTDLAGTRWVRPDNLHLTLRFIGDVSDEVMARCAEAMRLVEGPSFQLVASGAMLLPGSRRPRVLAVGLEESEPLEQLHRTVSEAINEAAGLPPETRHYTPHVTVARFRHSDGALTEKARRLLANVPRSRILVNDVILYRSTLGPGGSHYEALTRTLLEG